MKFISSRDNVRLKSLRALAEDTREQRRRNSTVLDGPHLVEAYFRQVGSPELVAISESGRDHMEIRELLAGFSGEILCFKDSLFREISGTASPVGIAAVIMIPAESSLPTQGDCIVLDAIQDAGNLGSILRSAAAAGVQDVVVGPGCAGPWTPRVLRAGQGAHFALNIREQDDLVGFIQAFPGQSIATVVCGAASLFSADLQSRSAWVFGSEGRGVSPEIEAACQHRITIPLASNSESLNVAAAAAVCLFETVRQKKSLGG